MTPLQTPAFQFHNGSIKSFASNIANQAWTVFQFHNGSIKSTTLSAYRDKINSFNSTMVRLKADLIRINALSQ